MKELEKILENVKVNLSDGDCTVDIDFSRLEAEFTTRDRIVTLYSHIRLESDRFVWDSIVPTVKIPFKDSSIGFLINDNIVSSIGIYQRSPGVVSGYQTKVANKLEAPMVNIITDKNNKFSLQYRQHGVIIEFKQGTKMAKIPIGVFLKAFSQLPYSEILSRIAYKPQMLLNSFPCEIVRSKSDFGTTGTYGISGDSEPTVEECIDFVYRAISRLSMTKAAKQLRDKNQDDAAVSTSWKAQRIEMYVDNMHFKNPRTYELSLSLGNRAIGTRLDEDIDLPVFDAETGEETSFVMHAGTYITDTEATELRKYDITRLQVKAKRSFILQDDAPVVFRAKGYKLAEDVDDIPAGTVITDAILDQLNEKNIYYLDVETPRGRKMLRRSDSKATLEDFCTILNYMFTNPFQDKEDSTQYDVGNRIVKTYEVIVRNTVEQVYNNIVNCIMGCDSPQYLLRALPSLPDTSLLDYLRNAKKKEVTPSELTNIMSRAIQSGKSSALLKETPTAMTMIQKGQYGRLDSLHAPESQKIGSVQQYTVFAKINPDSGEIETPYEVIEDGKPTGKIEYISASKENFKHIVAWDTPLTDEEKAQFPNYQPPDENGEEVYARCNCVVDTIPKSRIDYREVSPYFDMSVSRATIPFPEFSQPKRSLMATKMNGQAVPILFPERARVSTGADTEIPCLYYTVRDILQQSGIEAVEGKKLEIIEHRWEKRMVVYTLSFNDHVFDFSLPFTATDEKTLYNYETNIKQGYIYDLDDIVFYNHSCDLGEYEFWTRVNQGKLPVFKDASRPAMALGVNLRVGYKTAMSSTIDDAVVISDRLIKDMTLSSIQIVKYEYELKKNETFNRIDGCAALHSFVHTDEPVISIMRMGKSGYRNRTIKAKQSGEVVYSHCQYPSETNGGKGFAEVWVSTFHHAEIGDKVAGRYGNKSVIARVLPEEWMPYDPETGETLDMCLSPLGIPSRMNFGQILEVVLGAVMSKENKIAVVSPFYPNIKDDIRQAYEQAGLAPKKLFNPIYGKYTERPILVGTMYMLKLEQISNLKIYAVGYPRNTDPVFGQPVTSIDAPKGQRIGEMESWALAAAGADNLLDDIFTWYAADDQLRKLFFSALNANESEWDERTADIKSHRSPNRNASVSEAILRTFGCDLVVDNGKYRIVPLDMSKIPKTLDISSFRNKNEGDDGEHAWAKIRLPFRVVHPFWVTKFPLNRVLGCHSAAGIIAGTEYFDEANMRTVLAKDLDDDEKQWMITGMTALVRMLELYHIDDVIRRLSGGSTLKQVETDSEDYDYDGHFEVVSEEEPKQEDDGESILSSAEEEDVVTSRDEWEKIHSNSTDDSSDEDEGEQNANCNQISDIRIVRFLKYLQSQGKDLDCFIMSYFPVIPKLFRPSSFVNGGEQDHSFYKQIRQIVEASSPDAIYEAIRVYIGDEKDAGNNHWISIRGYFFGKGSEGGHHGTFRENTLSKRVGFSGRAVITPAQDMYMSPFFIGIPWYIVVRIYNDIIAMRIQKLGDRLPGDDLSFIELSGWKEIVKSLHEYNPYVIKKYYRGSDAECLQFYYSVRALVKRIVEGEVRRDGAVKIKGKWMYPEEVPESETIDACMGIVGRQPTLHKKSIRSYFIKLVDGYSIHIHPLVCASYNADFDGDTMYNMAIFGESKIEAAKTISVLQDLISEKDRSFTLEVHQDAVLGIYCMTTYKDNDAAFTGSSWYYYDNRETLRFDLEYGDLKYYDAVLYYDGRRYYLSTAGRVLLNLYIPNCLTEKPFSDKHGIAKAVGLENEIPNLCELRYDDVMTATGIRPVGRPNAVTVSNILQAAFEECTARQTVMLCQDLFELGIVASDLYGVSMTLDDMSVKIKDENGEIRPLESFMKEPKDEVRRLSSLYDLGLITDEERKSASVNVWNRARDSVQDRIIASIDPKSNTFYLMYSGARGKPDQVMQSVGFIGTIAKTRDSDIEYPILRGYGQGLTAFDLMQTCYSARIGVVSTQTGTRDAGYATRQSVYMTSGLQIVEDDCGINNRILEVEYEAGAVILRYPDGSTKPIEDLLGEFVNDSDRFDVIKTPLSRNGFMVNQEVIELIISNGLEYVIDLDDQKVEILRSESISPAWRTMVTEEYYSYALPYLDENGRLTDATVDWIASKHLHEVIAYPESEKDNCFDLEAYLPVDYDTSRYKVHDGNGKLIDEEVLYSQEIDESSEGYHYYKRLLSEHHTLTLKALSYLTKKKIHTIKFRDGSSATVTYEISSLFKDVCKGRFSRGLFDLSPDGCITDLTLKDVEEMQLNYIPVRTTLTCLSRDGICAKCFGKVLSLKKVPKVGTSVGISAVQALSEPVTQTTMNVTHTGGKRASGTQLISGLDYFQSLIKATMVSRANASEQESFVETYKQSPTQKLEGYVVQDVMNPNSISIENDAGDVLRSGIMLDDPARLNVPSGAYVDETDTLISGMPYLDRYSNEVPVRENSNAPKTVFEAALKTRYLMLNEYHKIFSSLKVASRNYEIMCRAQTSQCYLACSVDAPDVRDTSEECLHPTGYYELRVSKQPETVAKFSGVAAFGFERQQEALSSAILTPENVKLTSFLGNLVTGTKIGSKEAEFKTESQRVRSGGYSRVGEAFTEGRLDEALRFHNTGTILSAPIAPDPGESGMMALGAPLDFASLEDMVPQSIAAFSDILATDDSSDLKLYDVDEDTNPPEEDVQANKVEDDTTVNNDREHTSVKKLTLN